MILACQSIGKSFGTDTILKDVSFHIEAKEKTALIGINGAGKSTLLKIITGEESADEGEIVSMKGITIGYLAQNQGLDSDLTIYEELKTVYTDLFELEEKIHESERAMKHLDGNELEKELNTYHRLTASYEERNGYAWKSELTGVLKGLGFPESDFDKSISTLSGGQKTRIALGKLLLTRPDLIMLDEPTNHLDMESIGWLEGYLSGYPGAVLIVSHDRYFLDRVVTKVVELDQTKSYVFQGNYTAYAQKKKQMRDTQLKAWLNQQREIAHQEEVITRLKSFNREKSIKRAESREKMLDRIDRLDKPTEAASEMHIFLEPDIESGKDVLTADGIAKHFEDSPFLFRDLSFEIKRGERVAIIGNNGTGKTTILKLINGLTSLDEGSITLGSKVHIGYYDQEHQVLHPEKTLFEEISDEYPTLTITRIRNILASFLFTGDDVFKKIADLSGGEKGRVSLAKLMLSEANFLILDEPTNHLDIISKEILENALNNYTGTVLYVSHDRYFVNHTATRILELTDCRMIPYLGNYDYYLEKREDMHQRFLAPAAAAETVVSTDGKQNWQIQKQNQAKLKKLKKMLTDTENLIEKLETRNDELDELMARPETATNSAKLNELNTEKEQNEEKLMELMETWEELQELLS